MTVRAQEQISAVANRVTGIENMTIDEAIKATGLDWKVEEEKLFGGTNFQPVNSHKLMVRSDTKKSIGLVGSGYTPIQNDEAFAFFNPFIQSGQAKLHATGTLKHGARIFIQAKVTGASGEVVPGDQIDSYLLLANSHDGTLSVCVTFTPTRLACSNQLHAMTRGMQSADRTILKIRHTSRVKQNLAAVQAFIDTTRRSFEVSLENYKLLQSRKMNIQNLEDYVRNVFQMPIENEEDKEKLPRAYKDIERLIETGAGSDIPGVKGTLWGAYNAITEWCGTERGKISQEERVNSNLFGQGEKVRRRALNEALALV